MSRDEIGLVMILPRLNPTLWSHTSSTVSTVSLWHLFAPDSGLEEAEAIDETYGTYTGVQGYPDQKKV